MPCVMFRFAQMNRRHFLKMSLIGSAATWMHSSTAATGPKSKPDFEWDETTISQLSSSMSSGRLTAVSLTRQYLRCMRDLDKGGPKLNSVIELNPDAISIAEALDVERQKSGPRGRLHGIPILIKDNIATRDKMQTTAGSFALVGSVPPADAFLVQRLRSAGAVILGKTNMSEWANFRSTHATSGWSGRGGLTLNPYVLDRNPSGSSSGSAVAVSANLCAVAVGTETDGSITPRDALASAGDTLRKLVDLVAELSEAPRGLELGEVASPTSTSPDLDLPIEELDLSERPRNCLKRARVDSIGQLVQKSEDDLLAITNFGAKSLEEVIQKLDERGLSLRVKE